MNFVFLILIALPAFPFALRWRKAVKKAVKNVDYESFGMPSADFSFLKKVGTGKHKLQLLAFSTNILLGFSLLGGIIAGAKTVIDYSNEIPVFQSTALSTFILYLVPIWSLAFAANLLYTLFGKLYLFEEKALHSKYTSKLLRVERFVMPIVWIASTGLACLVSIAFLLP